MPEKSLLLRTLGNEPVERAPVWMMRQAGRYLAEYRALKDKHTFLELCKTPELALEVSLQPIRILDVDAAILFSDILIPLEGMGIEIDFNPGPQIKNPIKNGAQIAALRFGDPHEYAPFVIETVKHLRQALPRDKTLIGFAGAPWTMACYLIDQGPYKHFLGTQVFSRENRAATHQLLEKLATVVSDYLLAQVEAGAEVIQLFDTWAGNLSGADYREFALPYTQRILERVREKNVPTILYVNGCSHLLEDMAESGAICLSIDWRLPFVEAQSRLPDNLIVQGNLDPADLFGTTDQVRNVTRQMIASWKRRSGYIANLGHGILQGTPRENARTFVDTVKEGWQ